MMMMSGALCCACYGGDGGEPCIMEFLDGTNIVFD